MHGPSGSKYGPQPHDMLVVLKGGGRVRSVAETLHIPMHDYNHRKHPLVRDLAVFMGHAPPQGPGCPQQGWERPNTPEPRMHHQYRFPCQGCATGASVPMYGHVPHQNYPHGALRSEPGMCSEVYYPKLTNILILVWSPEGIRCELKAFSRS